MCRGISRVSDHRAPPSVPSFSLSSRQGRTREKEQCGSAEEDAPITNSSISLLWAAIGIKMDIGECTVRRAPRPRADWSSRIRPPSADLSNIRIGPCATFTPRYMLCSYRLTWTEGRVAQRQNHLRRGDDLLNSFHERPHEFARKFGSIVGPGCQVELDSKLFIDKRTYCYTKPRGPQCARHRQKCDANIFCNQLKSFLGA